MKNLNIYKIFLNYMNKILFLFYFIYLFFMSDFHIKHMLFIFVIIIFYFVKICILIITLFYVN